MAEACSASGSCDDVPDGRSAAGPWGQAGSVFEAMMLALGCATGSASANERCIGRGFSAQLSSVIGEIAPKGRDSLRAQGDMERLVPFPGPIQRRVIGVQVSQVADLQPDDLLCPDASQAKSDDESVPAAHGRVVQGVQEGAVGLVLGEPARRILGLSLSIGGPELAERAVGVRQVFGGRCGDARP